MADLAKFIRDAPPGELEAVRKDIDTLTGGNHSVGVAVAREVEQYNVANLRIVAVRNFKTVLSQYNRLSDTEFTSTGLRFTVDHQTGATSAVEDYEPLSAAAKKLQKELAAYVADHYPGESVCDVFDTADGLAAVVVGRKLSPHNFFNGQWTAEYTIGNKEVGGEIRVDVHYFEEGNVRLKSKTTVAETAASGDAAAVVKAIERAENAFETELNRTLVGVNESEFKALRRQLPVTRSQMVWGKAVGSYRLGRELEGAGK